MAGNKATCSVSDCVREERARGLCASHYAKESRRETLPPGRDRDALFWAKVDRNGPGGCWIWTAHLKASGYGGVKRYGRDHYAHRVAYELLRGQIAADKVLDHLCRNRACVNPDHLEEVEFKENVLRGVGYPAQQARKTHCKRGHPFDDDNTYVWGSSRICRACRAGAG